MSELVCNVERLSEWVRVGAKEWGRESADVGFSGFSSSSSWSRVNAVQPRVEVDIDI